MRRLTALAGVALGITTTSALAAEPCFCLGDEDDTVWYDCRTFRVGLDPNPQFECRSGPDEERVLIEQGHTLQRYEAGRQPCVPCKVEQQPIGDQIRGEESQGPNSDKEKSLTPRNAPGVNPSIPESDPASKNHD